MYETKASVNAELLGIHLSFSFFGLSGIVNPPMVWHKVREYGYKKQAR